jgi:hypothetical protein
MDDFYAAYERLSETGACDSPGGMEYERFRGEWIACCQPADLDSFIKLHANIGPDLH